VSCHTNTAIKHSVPDRVKPSFVIFDIWALWRSVGVKGLSWPNSAFQSMLNSAIVSYRSTVVWWHELGEVENECTICSLFAIILPRNYHKRHAAAEKSRDVNFYSYVSNTINSIVVVRGHQARKRSYFIALCVSIEKTVQDTSKVTCKWQIGRILDF